MAAMAEAASRECRAYLSFRAQKARFRRVSERTEELLVEDKLQDFLVLLGESAPLPPPM